MTEIGLGFQSDKSWDDYQHLARIAEEGGVDVLTVYGDLMYQPPLAALLAMARATSVVRLGPSCLNPYSASPHEIAGQMALLDLTSRGRAFLGLARGSWLEDVGIRQDRPLTRIRECWEVVRRLLAGDETGYEGSVYSLAQGTRLHYPVARPSIPLLIGSWGPEMTALAGQIADEVKVGGSANPAMVPMIRERLGSGTGTRVVVGSVTVVDRDGEAARLRARREVAMYLAVVGELDPTVDVPSELLDEVRSRLEAGDRDRAGEPITDDILDAFCFAGTPDEVATRAQALIEAGCDRVEFGTPHGLTDVEGGQLITNEVIPALRR